MKLELNDGHSNSNHSDFSEGSQSSQESMSNDISSSARPVLARLMFSNLEGLNSGVPTRTTATLTPTTLRAIDHTFFELQRAADSPNHAGFVPPLVNMQTACFATNSSNSSSQMYEDVPLHLPLHVSPGPSSCGESSISSPCSQPPRKRNTGGRRPNQDYNLSPEEEERRRQRRDRNKAAAARCRKRRLDQTTTLENQTSDLENTKMKLEEELNSLMKTCQQLEYILDNHRPACRLSLPEIKPFIHDDQHEFKIKVENVDDLFEEPEMDPGVMLSSATLINRRPTRPTSLAVPPPPNRRQNPATTSIANIAGIEINTPSGCTPFNFESIMDGGTGLTPVQPYATQTRHDLTTPDMPPRNNKFLTL